MPNVINKPGAEDALNWNKVVIYELYDFIYKSDLKFIGVVFDLNNIESQFLPFLFNVVHLIEDDLLSGGFLRNLNDDVLFLQSV